MTGLSRYYERCGGICVGLMLGSMTITSGCAEVPVTRIPDASRMKPEIVVFDVDGTLTPTVTEIFTARQDAATAAQMYAKSGYRIVYLTARVRVFQGALPMLLKENGFPPGDIVAPKTDTEQKHPYNLLNSLLQLGCPSIPRLVTTVDPEEETGFQDKTGFKAVNDV
ncbi:MAG: hypothetical protein H6976_05885 [Gammaproteobacteria bacterium]|nr:hypothetical protein [Gammaproteobacteria bacterium]